jgi:hypothetical protein
MGKSALSVALRGALIGVMLTGALAFALGNEEIRRLKQAGVSDETIAVMVKEKSQETCSFTAEEVVKLKAAGIGEETIRLLIEESSFLKNREPVVYGNATRTLRVNTAEDIIGLKGAGLSDEVIRAIIIAGAQDRDTNEREQAWEMLKNMGIILDGRKNN